jgi:ABC-type transport system involved in multi-copper enzyme maturation permease subunit
MIKFSFRLLLKNKILWVWPAIIFFSVLEYGILGNIQSTTDSYPFLAKLGYRSFTTSAFLLKALPLVTIISIIGLVPHFDRNINSERAALIFSRPISRTEFFFSDFAAMLLVSFLYNLSCVILYGILVGIKAGIFPLEPFISLLIFIPLYILSYYVTIIFLLLITNSYLTSTILGYFLTGFSEKFLPIDNFLNMFGIQSPIGKELANILSYLIPSSEGIKLIMSSTLNNGFSALDWGLLMFSITSLLPLFLLSYFMFKRKEF